MRILLRLFFASLIFALSWALFREVLPVSAACAVAIVLALAEVTAPAIARSGAGNIGGGLRLFVRLGATLIAWPIAAWALDTAGLRDRPARIAIAAAVASAVGVMAAGHGSGKDTVRLWAVVAAAAVPCYALMQGLAADPVDPLAVTCGCGAVAVSLLVARQAIIWPVVHERALAFAAGAATFAGLFAGALLIL